MSLPLLLIGGGAVSPIGLDRAQTCAGIRARMARFEDARRNKPFGETQAVARVPAHWQLRITHMDWLVNMAARAVREVVDRQSLQTDRAALVLIPPESFRQNAFAEAGDSPAEGALLGLAGRVVKKLGLPFVAVEQTIQGGAAALALALDLAHQFISRREATHVLVLSADSYVMDSEFNRLDAAGRLRTNKTAQGLTPGEGAACALLTSADSATALEPSALILGWSTAEESCSALSPDHSQGKALVASLREAAAKAGIDEAELGWSLSNNNGERYAAWESILAHTRYYRTRRERLISVLPAMSVGEAGASAGPLALLACAHRYSYLDRKPRSACAMIELASEAGGRTACVVAPTGVAR